MRIPYRSILSVSLLLGGCGGTGSSLADEAADLHTQSFVDAVEYLSAEGNGALEQWVELRQRLASNFADACGDTFCEGDYSDLQPLELRCAVGAQDGALHACTWALAGSMGRVNPSTGALKTQGKLYSCRLPVSGTINALLGALLAPGEGAPLRRALPGSTGSIYDALGDCGVGH